MAIQVLKALASATTVVAVDTSEDKLKIAKNMGADEALISGDDAVKRIKDITRVRVRNSCSTWSASIRP